MDHFDKRFNTFSILYQVLVYMYKAIEKRRKAFPPRYYAKYEILPEQKFERNPVIG